MEEVYTKRERRCDLSDTYFPGLPFLLSSIAYARTEGARAKRQPCGDELTPCVLDRKIGVAREKAKTPLLAELSKQGHHRHEALLASSS